MAYENLNAVILGGTAYNCGRLSQSALNWLSGLNLSIANQSDSYELSAHGDGFFRVPPALNSWTDKTIENSSNAIFRFAGQSWRGFNFLVNNNVYQTCTFSGSSGDDNWDFGIAIDHTNEYAVIWVYWAYSSNGHRLYIASWGSAVNAKALYNAVMGAQPVLYNWSSVPAISGKNGILLPMSTLNDINDGNEVTTSDTSKFNLNDSSNIKNLVDAVVNDF